MTAYAETDGVKIFLTVELSDSMRAKEVPGARWDSKKRVWRYPLSWATCVALRGVFAQDLEIGPNLTEWATSERQSRVGPAMEARTWMG